MSDDLSAELKTKILAFVPSLYSEEFLHSFSPDHLFFDIIKFLFPTEHEDCGINKRDKIYLEYTTITKFMDYINDIREKNGLSKFTQWSYNKRFVSYRDIYIKELIN